MCLSIEADLYLRLTNARASGLTTAAVAIPMSAQGVLDMWASEAGKSYASSAGTRVLTVAVNWTIGAQAPDDDKGPTGHCWSS